MPIQLSTRSPRAPFPTKSFHHNRKSSRHSPQVLTPGRDNRGFHQSHAATLLNYGINPGHFTLPNSPATSHTRTLCTSAHSFLKPSSTTKTRRRPPFESSVHVSTLHASPIPLQIPTSFDHLLLNLRKSSTALWNISFTVTRSPTRGRLAKARIFPMPMYFPRRRRRRRRPSRHAHLSAPLFSASSPIRFVISLGLLSDCVHFRFISVHFAPCNIRNRPFR